MAHITPTDEYHATPPGADSHTAVRKIFTHTDLNSEGSRPRSSSAHRQSWNLFTVFLIYICNYLRSARSGSCCPCEEEEEADSNGKQLRHQRVSRNYRGSSWARKQTLTCLFSLSQTQKTRIQTRWRWFIHLPLKFTLFRAGMRLWTINVLPVVGVFKLQEIPDHQNPMWL